jgi:hypothetical protein
MNLYMVPLPQIHVRIIFHIFHIFQNISTVEMEFAFVVVCCRTDIQKNGSTAFARVRNYDKVRPPTSPCMTTQSTKALITNNNTEWSAHGFTEVTTVRYL